MNLPAVLENYEPTLPTVLENYEPTVPDNLNAEPSNCSRKIMKLQF